MPRDTRAVLFDLDDTLYPQRRFILSGFAVVANHGAASATASIRAGHLPVLFRRIAARRTVTNSID